MWLKILNIIIIFLIIAVSVNIYSSYQNSRKNIEKFSVSNDTIYLNTINKVFMENLLRPPESFEIDNVKPLMKSSLDSETILNIIKQTDEYQEIIKVKTAIDSSSGIPNQLADPTSDLNIALESLNSKERMNIYKDIINAYETNLDRMPTMRELNYYSYRITKDPNFTATDLITILVSSTEHKILEKNQTNIVNGELPGNVTDAQLTLQVRDIYQQVFETDSFPNKELEDFLKTKYVEYLLDNVRLTNLLLFLKAADINAISVSVDNTNTVVIKTKGIQVNESIANIVTDETVSDIISVVNSMDPTKTTINMTANSEENFNSNSNTNDNSNSNTNDTSNSNDTSNDSNSNSTNYNTIDPTSINSTSNSQNNNTKQIRKKTCSYSVSPYTDNLYETLKCANSINFDKYTSKDRSFMAEYQYNRNIEEMKSACSRNSYFLNADDNMVLYPEFKWSVPEKRPPVCTGGTSQVSPMIDQSSLIGTLLEDADNTKVGSIMKPFIYVEN